MLRWTFNIAAAVSLVLLLASCVAWMRSLSRVEHMTRRNGQRAIMFLYDSGKYELHVATLGPDFADGYSSGVEWLSGSEKGNSGGDWSIEKDLPHHSRFGVFDYHALLPSDNDDGFESYYAIVIPIWFATLLFAISPVVRFVILRKYSRRYRRKRGLCPACGYDLRSSRGACPECGAGRVQSE